MDVFRPSVSARLGALITMTGGVVGRAVGGHRAFRDMLSGDYALRSCFGLTHSSCSGIA